MDAPKPTPATGADKVDGCLRWTASSVLDGFMFVLLFAAFAALKAGGWWSWLILITLAMAVVSLVAFRAHRRNLRASVRAEAPPS